MPMYARGLSLFGWTTIELSPLFSSHFRKSTANYEYLDSKLLCSDVKTETIFIKIENDATSSLRSKPEKGLYLTQKCQTKPSNLRQHSANEENVAALL